MARRQRIFWYYSNTHLNCSSGSIRSLLTLVRHLDRKKYEPVVFFYRENIFCDALREDKIQVICAHKSRRRPVRIPKPRAVRKSAPWQFGLLVKRKLVKLSQIPRLYFLIRKIKPDFVVGNNGLDSDVPVILAAALNRVPVIDFIRSTLSGAGFLEWIASRCVRQFYSVAEFIRKDYEARYPALKGRVSVLKPPVEHARRLPGGALRRFRDRWGIRDRFKVISNIGRLVPEKGFMEFLQAFALVVEKRGNVQCLIVGDGEFQKPLEAAARSLRLGDHVIFTGYISNIEEVYSASDLVVHTAVYQEPAARVVLEALLRSKPVIVSSRGGVKEFVRDGVNGFCVDPEDTEKLADAMIKLLDNESLRDAIKAKAATSVRKAIDPSQIINAFQHTLQTVR